MEDKYGTTPAPEHRTKRDLTTAEKFKAAKTPRDRFNAYSDETLDQLERALVKNAMYCLLSGDQNAIAIWMPYINASNQDTTGKPFDIGGLN